MMKGIRGLLEKDFRLFFRQGGNLFLCLCLFAVIWVVCISSSALASLGIVKLRVSLL